MADATTPRCKAMMGFCGQCKRAAKGGAYCGIHQLAVDREQRRVADARKQREQHQASMLISEAERAVLNAAKAWRDSRTVFGQLSSADKIANALHAAVDALTALEAQQEGQ